jgi:hypothetical protein
MTEIETLLKGAIEKGIGAKPSVGDYSINIEYIKDGAKYILTKKSEGVIVIRRDIKRKCVTLDFSDSPVVRNDIKDVLTAIENQLSDYTLIL